MSDNIAGYIDRNFIKGQYYKLAGCPKPVIAGSTTNINEISDEILSKAVYAVVGQTAGGNFPNNTIGSTFLVTTVEYGNSVYLQTATAVEEGREYTYTRIYSGGVYQVMENGQLLGNATYYYYETVVRPVIVLPKSAL